MARPAYATAKQERSMPPSPAGRRFIENAQEDTQDLTTLLAQDPGARKRVELGLSPRRPTAKVAPARPPDQNPLPLPPVFLSLLLVAVVLATSLLVVVNLWQIVPSEWRIPRILAGAALPAQAEYASASLVTTTSVEYHLRVTDNFGRPTSVLAEGDQADAWRIELLPTEATYRMEVWPNRLAWSLLGVSNLSWYRVQTSSIVAGHTEWGDGGLIVRYQPDGSFYLFTVDGAGRYQVRLHKDGELTTIQDWERMEFLNPAGTANLLAVEDVGDQLRFYGNNMLLYEILAPELTLGDVGLAGGAQAHGVAEIRFDWFQLYELVSAE